MRMGCEAFGFLPLVRSPESAGCGQSVRKHLDHTPFSEVPLSLPGLCPLGDPPPSRVPFCRCQLASPKQGARRRLPSPWSFSLRGHEVSQIKPPGSRAMLASGLKSPDLSNPLCTKDGGQRGQRVDLGSRGEPGRGWPSWLLVRCVPGGPVGLGVPSVTPAVLCVSMMVTLYSRTQRDVTRIRPSLT